TGMGLERLAAVLQHVHSNYEIDLFQALIRAAARETGTTDLESKSLRVIADHIRAASFLIVDGIIPSSEGHGYVLRRIIRRALRHGHKLGQTKPFFYKLVEDLDIEMGDAYPELREAKGRVMQTLKAEEERFGETLENGMKILEAQLAKDPQNLDGATAFTLYDTYGFPLDLTADICRERNVTLDEAGFTAAMEQQKKTARAAGKFKMAAGVEYAGEKTKFVGYESLVHNTHVLALYAGGVSVQELQAGQDGIVVLDTTPFYAESGGQVGDKGVIKATGGTNAGAFEVEDTLKIQADVFGHHGVLQSGSLKVGDTVDAQVDEAKRARTIRNHSATHLMHKALREVLGSHVQQKGSLVDPDKTRFDFSHNAPLTGEEIARVEQIVNREILENHATQAQHMSMDDAIKHGAMALFGEKYGDTVRVLDIGSSKELCGGVHVTRTGDIGLFKIVSESGVAAGIRRVEAVTGEGALALVQAINRKLTEAAGALKTSPDELPSRIAQVQDQVKSLEKEIAALKSKLAAGQGDELVTQAIDVNGIKVLAATMEGADVAGLRETMDKLKDKLKTAAIVLASVADGKVSLIAGVTADATGKVKAGELVNFVAKQVGGKGGGRPDMAQ
ncbi:MAG: alanine--tRNA ligase, partial [Oxalobacteraceae bacterium]